MSLWERPSGRDYRGLKPRSYLKPMQNGYYWIMGFIEIEERRHLAMMNIPIFLCNNTVPQ